MEEVIWTTQDGQRIAVSEMTNSHLLNTIRYLGRRIKEFRKDVGYPNMMSELAQEIAEREYEKAEDLYCAMIDMREIMKKEASKRRLKVSPK